MRWRNLSLAVVNAGGEVPDRFRAAVEATARAHRVIAALLADGRNDLVGDFYTEWGRRFHHDGTPNEGLAPRGQRPSARSSGRPPSTRSSGTSNT